jgi:hypothetical protein
MCLPQSHWESPLAPLCNVTVLPIGVWGFYKVWGHATLPANPSYRPQEWQPCFCGKISMNKCSLSPLRKFSETHPYLTLAFSLSSHRQHSSAIETIDTVLMKPNCFTTPCLCTNFHFYNVLHHFVTPRSTYTQRERESASQLLLAKQWLTAFTDIQHLQHQPSCLTPHSDGLFTL